MLRIEYKNINFVNEHNRRNKAKLFKMELDKALEIRLYKYYNGRLFIRII